MSASNCFNIELIIAYCESWAEHGFCRQMKT